ncbi:hypothetical protein FNW12_07070 [Flavobacterium gawalongense]|uniref:Uncharacterized protein n=2 Tax=Flavobacterium gawalongense TaxID=2594432 RepID=A0ABY3CM99_9FLAO|nr:hypothetical protein FNW33_02660 [Flavobacterium gawalongense]TRX07198.1 hypothetical protein FNW12_07070 [Flavobacterium gawalongense]
MLAKPVLPVLEYVVNYEYISKVLCINKDKPKMQCNGKCHLMKELAKASDADKPVSSDKKVTAQVLEVLFFEEIQSFKITLVCFGTKEKINPVYSNLYSHLNLYSIFHPPISIS